MTPRTRLTRHPQPYVCPMPMACFVNNCIYSYYVLCIEVKTLPAVRARNPDPEMGQNSRPLFYNVSVVSEVIKGVALGTHGSDMMIQICDPMGCSEMLARQAFPHNQWGLDVR